MNRTNYLLFLFLFLLASMDLKALIGGDPRLTRDIVINTNEIVRGIACANTPITQSDVGSTGFTITTPGVYFVLENIDFAPGAPASAITISSDDVILDLRCFILSQTNATPGVNGVHVVSGLDNVIIRNGMITDFTGDGILVEDGTSAIVANDVVISSCDRGLALEGSLGSPIVDVELVGLELKSCSTGLAYYFTQEGLVQKCNALSNTSAGYDIRTSFSNQFIRCAAYDTNANLGNAFGVFVDNGSKNIFEQWRIEGTSTNSTFTGDTATAFFIGSAEENLILKHSQISNSTTTSSAQPFGVQMQYTFTALTDLGLTFTQNGSVQSVAWTFDGRYLALGGDSVDGYVRVFEFDGTSLEQVATFADNIISTTSVSVSWSPDGKYLAAATFGGAGEERIRVFEFNGTSLDNIVTSTDLGTSILSVNWSPDGRYIATGQITNPGGPEIRVFEFTGTTLEEVAQLNTGSTAQSVEWAPNGKYLAIGGSVSGTDLRVLEFTGTDLIDVASFIHGASVFSVSWSLDGRFLAMGGSSGADGFQVRVLEFTGTLDLRASFSHGDLALSVDWSPDGKYIVIGGDLNVSIPEIRVLEFVGNALIDVANLESDHIVFAVAWISNGQYIATGETRVQAGPIFTGQVRVLSGLQFPQGCTIFDNLINCVKGAPLPAGSPGVSNGRGLSASSGTNLIIQNNSFNNDVNYVFVSDIYEQFLVNVKSQVPSTIDNLSFPPL